MWCRRAHPSSALFCPSGLPARRIVSLLARPAFRNSRGGYVLRLSSRSGSSAFEVVSIAELRVCAAMGWLTEWTQHLRPLNSCWPHDGTRRVNGRPAASRSSRSSSKERKQVLERARSTPGALRSGDGCGAAQSLAVCGTERQASRATAVTATDRRAGTRRRGRQQAPRNAEGRRAVLAARRAGSGGAGGGGDAAFGRWSRIAVQWLVEESPRDWRMAHPLAALGLGALAAADARAARRKLRSALK